jgi:hypothetical protein
MFSAPVALPILSSVSCFTLLDVCEKLAREYVVREGGRIEKDANGEDVFVIPVRKPTPSPLVFSWEPEPVENSLFTEIAERLSRRRNNLSVLIYCFAVLQH